MTLGLTQLERLAAICTEASGMRFECIQNRKIVLASHRFRSTTSILLPECLDEATAMDLFAPGADPLTNAVRAAYVDSLATLNPIIKTVREAPDLPAPSSAVEAIRSAAESKGIDVNTLIAQFRLQLIPTLQGLELDSILNKFAPIKGGEAMFGAHQVYLGEASKKRGEITAWSWSWAELSPNNIDCTQIKNTSHSPMEWVDEDDMIMLTAQALEGRLKITDLPYNKNQLDAMEIFTRIRLGIRGLLGHPHTLTQGANGKNHFVYIDPWNRNLVTVSRCPNSQVQTRQALRALFSRPN